MVFVGFVGVLCLWFACAGLDLGMRLVVLMLMLVICGEFCCFVFDCGDLLVISLLV